MFRFHRKKSIALLLTICFLFVMVMPGYAADTGTGADSCTVGVAIVDNQGNLIFGSKSVKVQSSAEYGMTALGALAATGVTYEVDDDDKIISINGLENDLVNGKGWRLAVNGGAVGDSAEAYALKEGDHIVWYYGASDADPPQWDILQIPDNTNFEPSSINQGEGEIKQVEAVLNKVNGNKTVTVSIAIVGKDGELIYEPGEVTVQESGEWGLTALGALEATGVSYEVKDTDYGPYVTSVNGQAGDPNGGWMYTVNDK
ncbi:MAG TPA: DUF4430 domain-containing protein, partial [Syntrophaceticus sp.]|nr:DUF4430 domain-containing protein [Syntrophaceticus sp.]